MLVDLEDCSSLSLEHESTVVCIAGAGVAGLVLATALARSGVEVYLLEAGGLNLETRSQSIYDAEMAATTHHGTSIGRFRVFGGSSTYWGGQILPYTDDIFLPPAGLGGVEWPLKACDIEPFYAQVEDILGANHLPFDSRLLKSLGHELPEQLANNSDIDLRFSQWAPFSRRNVAKTLGDEAVNSANITVFLHANVTECLLSPDGSRVEALLVRNYRGNCFCFTAQEYVLATGTIETSRLLLASRSVCPEGAGNHHDQVGRRFHDHISAPVAKLQHASREKLFSWMGPFFSGGITYTGKLEAAVSLRTRLKLPPIMAYFTIDEPDNSGMFLVRHLLRSFQRGEIRSALLGSYRQLPAASLDVAKLAYYARIKKRRAVSSKAVVELCIDCEQQATPQNRIRLAEKSTDLLGIPKAVVDWRVSSDEIRSIRSYARWLRDAAKGLGIGSVDWDQDVMASDSDKFPEIRDTNHAMGGTVMGVDPANSVVDAELRVHGVANLYVASCSTFPSGGSSNPTFTLMALTFRLAERLKRSLRVPVVQPVRIRNKKRHSI